MIVSMERNTLKNPRTIPYTAHPTGLNPITFRAPKKERGKAMAAPRIVAMRAMNTVTTARSRME